MANDSSKKTRQPSPPERRNPEDKIAIGIYLFTQRLEDAASWRDDRYYPRTLLLKSPN